MADQRLWINNCIPFASNTSRNPTRLVKATIPLPSPMQWHRNECDRLCFIRGRIVGVRHPLPPKQTEPSSSLVFQRMNLPFQSRILAQPEPGPHAMQGTPFFHQLLSDLPTQIRPCSFANDAAQLPFFLCSEPQSALNAMPGNNALVS